MQVLSPNDANIARAARHLREGGLVAFPTETVYGLGANASDGRAIAAVYEAKARPQFNPLIVHVAGQEAAECLGAFDVRAGLLAKSFWPGPLTLVLQRLDDAPISSLATAGLDTIALRVPAHPITRALITFAGVPVAAPSANRSGRVSATTAEHVAADFKHLAGFILNGGRSDGGLESTVVDLTGDQPALLRPGVVPREEIEAVLGIPLIRRQSDTDTPASPGMIASHYAPRARLRLNATEVRSGEVLLGFGPHAPAEAALNLSPMGDLKEAATNLFGYLRALDSCETDVIAVMPIPEEGLGEAINDRLARAAAPRPCTT